MSVENAHPILPHKNILGTNPAKNPALYWNHYAIIVPHFSAPFLNNFGNHSSRPSSPRRRTSKWGLTASWKFGKLTSWVQYRCTAGDGTNSGRDNGPGQDRRSIMKVWPRTGLDVCIENITDVSGRRGDNRRRIWGFGGRKFGGWVVDWSVKTVWRCFEDMWREFCNFEL